MTDEVAGVAACSNLSPGARRLRRSRTTILAGVTLAWLVASIALGMEWWMRAVVFVPAVLTVTNHFQATRSVCVLRAAQGKFEHDDQSTETMAGEQLRAARWIAFGIVRDATLIALPITIIAALSAWF